MFNLESSAQDVEEFEARVERGEILPTQFATAGSAWTAEKRLAGAVLTTTLTELRERYNDPAYRHRVTQDLEWIYSDEMEWPFSFVRLCHLFGLDPEWVRDMVERWRRAPVRPPQRASAPWYHAA